MTDYDVLVDELLSIEWGSRFESFSAKERRILEGFNTFAWQLGNRSFFRSRSRLHVGVSTELSHAGTEALELAGMTLRQSWQPKDPGCHERVIDILRRNVSDSPTWTRTEALLDEFHKGFCAARSSELMTFVDPEDLKQVGTPGSRMPRTVKALTAAEVLDDWLHGVVVHSSDPKKAAAVALWPAPSYEWSVIKAVTSITRAVLATHVVVRGALGVLYEDRRVRTGPGVTATATS